MNQFENFDQIITELDERGYSLIPSVIMPEKADAARTVLEDLLAAEVTDTTRTAKTQRVGRIVVKHPIFLELLTHPLIIALWQRYLGEDIICSSWSANTVHAGYDNFGWHSDYPYWSITPPWPEGNWAVQTIWMLNDLTVENGATAILSGSHKLRRPPDPEIKNQWIDEAEIVTGQRGSVVVMHGACWHTARPNQTQESRSVLLGMYMRPCFIPQEDMRTQLAELENPSELVQQLLGANQWQPKTVGTPEM